MTKKMITLAGFGDFSERMMERSDLERAAKEHGVEFYPTYYDHELKGDRDAIEAITKELYGMPRDQWSENALHETEI